MRRLIIFSSAVMIVAAAAQLAGCDDSAAARPDAGPHIDAGPEPTSLGEVLVAEMVDLGHVDVPERSYGHIEGRLRTGADPLWHQVTMDNGSCRLLKFQPALCEEFCENGLCTAPNVCEKFPALVPAGTLTVSGLATGTLALEPYDGYNAYYPQGPLPGELFADDATIVMSAEGSGDMPAFQASARAVARLSAQISSGQITLHDGEDHVVKWTPGDDPEARVRLTLNANNEFHGQPYAAIIECDVHDDAAQVTIPAAMIDGFPETENWSACAGSDCPRSWIRRYTRSYASVPGGGVRLEVGSEILFGVVHARP